MKMSVKVEGEQPLNLADSTRTSIELIEYIRIFSLWSFLILAIEEDYLKSVYIDRQYLIFFNASMQL